jgi:CrcB protein
MISTLLLVALGGAIGASLRWLSGAWVLRVLGPTDFPVAILAVNVLGSFVMGAFVAVAAQRGLAQMSPFVVTGLLGGFTTFSAFSLDTVTLIERGQVGLAAAYVGLSVALSVGALALGLIVARGALS